MSDRLECIACGTALENVTPNIGHQPLDGLSFHTHGHYGSSVFDPMDGSYIQIAVCDNCLTRAFERGVVRQNPPDPKSPYSLAYQSRRAKAAMKAYGFNKDTSRDG